MSKKKNRPDIYSKTCSQPTCSACDVPASLELVFFTSTCTNNAVSADVYSQAKHRAAAALTWWLQFCFKMQKIYFYLHVIYITWSAFILVQSNEGSTWCSLFIFALLIFGAPLYLFWCVAQRHQQWTCGNSSKVSSSHRDLLTIKAIQGSVWFGECYWARKGLSA